MSATRPAQSWIEQCWYLFCRFWVAIIETVVCLIVIIGIVIEHRRTSILKQEVQRLTEDVKGLVLAEQKRSIQDLKLATQKTNARKSAS